MAHLSQVGTLTRKDAAALLQVGETKIKKLFNALIKNGYIERMGQGRAIYYVIKTANQNERFVACLFS